MTVEFFLSESNQDKYSKSIFKLFERIVVPGKIGQYIDFNSYTIYRMIHQAYLWSIHCIFLLTLSL